MKTFPEKTAFVHILIGQSNMVRGTYDSGTPRAFDSEGRDMLFSDSGKSGSWGDASAPSSGVGAVIAPASSRLGGAYGPSQVWFGRRMTRRVNGGHHHIVKFAINGSRLSFFAVDQYVNLLATINAALAELVLAGYSPVLSSIFVWQGESDGTLTQADADSYQAQLVSFVASLRTSLASPQLPVAIMQLGTWQTAVTYLTTIRAAQAAVVAAVANTVLVGCEGFATADNLHGSSQPDYEVAISNAAEALLPII